MHDFLSPFQKASTQQESLGVGWSVGFTSTHLRLLHGGNGRENRQRSVHVLCRGGSLHSTVCVLLDACRGGVNLPRFTQSNVHPGQGH